MPAIVRRRVCKRDWTCHQIVSSDSVVHPEDQVLQEDVQIGAANFLRLDWMPVNQMDLEGGGHIQVQRRIDGTRSGCNALDFAFNVGASLDLLQIMMDGRACYIYRQIYRDTEAGALQCKQVFWTYLKAYHALEDYHSIKKRVMVGICGLELADQMKLDQPL